MKILIQFDPIQMRNLLSLDTQSIAFSQIPQNIFQKYYNTFSAVINQFSKYKFSLLKGVQHETH